MTWDAELLKYIINDRDNNEEAVEVLRRVTNTSFETEDVNATICSECWEKLVGANLTEEGK